MNRLVTMNAVVIVTLSLRVAEAGVLCNNTDCLMNVSLDTDRVIERPADMSVFGVIPSPVEEPEKCGRDHPSYICDPDGLLTKDEGKCDYTSFFKTFRFA